MRPWRRLVDREIERLWADVADVRDGIVDLDHRLAEVRQENAALADELSVLRNDYRGEAA